MLWSSHSSGTFGQNHCSKTTFFWWGRNLLSSTWVQHPTWYLASFTHLVTKNRAGTIHAACCIPFQPLSLSGKSIAHLVNVWRTTNMIPSACSPNFCFFFTMFLYSRAPKFCPILSQVIKRFAWKSSKYASRWGIPDFLVVTDRLSHFARAVSLFPLDLDVHATCGSIVTEESYGIF